jgi:hypothetical protein
MVRKSRGSLRVGPRYACLYLPAGGVVRH